MHTPVAIAPEKAAQAPSLDRTLRFTTRLDTALAGLADDQERRGFLSGQLVRWTGLYEKFLREVDAGTYEPPPGQEPAHPVDYVLTINAIDARLRGLVP